MASQFQRQKTRRSYVRGKKTIKSSKLGDKEPLMSDDRSDANGQNGACLKMSFQLQREKFRRSLRKKPPRKRINHDEEEHLISDNASDANEDENTEIHKNHATDETPEQTQKLEDTMLNGFQRSPHLEFTKEMRRISAENKESNGTTDQQSGVYYVKETYDIAKSEVRCFECIQAFPVNSADEILPGDHIVSIGVIYDHHAIILKREGELFTIREATNTKSGAVLGILFGGKARIKTSKRQFNFAKERICVVKYNRRFSPEVTISKANNYEEEFTYNLCRNNCEHFATKCVTGQSISVQVSKLRLAWKLFWSSGFIGISDEKKRNEKGYDKRMICKKCFEMNENLLEVTKIRIERETLQQISKGDIIRYTYWNLWHEAVVLKILKKTETTVKCQIAHYAFCGLFSHRTIKSEPKTFRSDGKCFKLDYAEPKYDVYHPDEVVKRAEESLNEQWFVFFANDSSHFARWCKLKLKKESLDVQK